MVDSSPVKVLLALAQADDAHRLQAAKELSQATQRLLDTTGRGLDLTQADLSGLDLSGADLRRATLNRAVLHGTRLAQANLSEITMVCPGMERTVLTGANLRSAYVHALAAQTCNFDGADLTGLRDATGTLFHGCSMRGVRLDGSHLAGAAFYQCDLSEASFQRANLQGAQLNECLLDAAEFSGVCVDQLTVTKSSLRDTSFVHAGGRGLVLQRLTCADGLVLSDARLPRLRLDSVRGHGWQAARLAAPGADCVGVFLTSADLHQADLSNSRWEQCSLPEANFTAAVLNNAKVAHSNLRGATLTGAHGENLNLVESDLSKADLGGFAGRCMTARDVNLSGADLRHANLYRAMLTGDPPRGMSLRAANLESATLVQAYVAADLQEARLVGANCAYSRFNQSDLSSAWLDGAGMYQSSWVKTTLHGARLTEVQGPLFADRCPGLAVALEDANGPVTDELAAFLGGLSALLASGRRGST